MKVLVAAPTSDRKDYCLEDWAKMVKSLYYHDYDILLVDNSHDPNHVKKLLRLGIRAIHIPPQGTPVQYITMCQNFIREFAIAGNYDYLLMLETDVFVPKNIILHMIGYREPVVNISYLIKQGKDTTLCLQGITDDGRPPRMGLVPFDVAASIYTGECRQVDDFKIGPDWKFFAPGIGCTLIHNYVLRAVKFRYDFRAGKGVFSDSFFHFDLLQMGIINMLDTSITVEHRRDNWQHLITELYGASKAGHPAAN